ncbi:MAG: hypothetical protein HY875_16410 [Chloroflexi bacterium]|nr:hypothetical protein [Chloroflexota bacterium]
MRLRTIVAVPAGAPLDPALESDADAVALPLNDARVPSPELRQAFVAAVPRIVAAGKLAVAVVNHPRTRLLRDDLEAIVAPGLAAVLLPHAADPQDVRDLAVLLREFEHTRGIEPGTVAAFPVIDSARGLLRAAEIAHAAPRVAGLVFDATAYAHDVFAREEEHGPRLAYARGAVVAAARAYDLLPLVAGSHLEARSLAQYGFAGIVLREAGSAVVVANTAFAPTEAARARAQRHLDAYSAARGEGDWVARVDDEAVDAHDARKARQLLA